MPLVVWIGLGIAAIYGLAAIVNILSLDRPESWR